MKNKFLLTTKIVLSVIFFCFCAEIVCRLLGFQAFPHINEADIQKIWNTNNFNNYMCNDSYIGLVPCEHKEKIIYQVGKIPFKVTHLKDGSRFCGSTKTNHSERVLLLTGDSNIHGDGVDDSSHVGFLLQKRLQDFWVINKAIPGSGNVSQLLVLKKSLQEYTPDIVIATYASYHNHRNIFSRNIRKAFSIPNERKQVYEFPLGRIINDSLKVFKSHHYYHPMPFSDISAFAEAINIMIESFQYKYADADLVTTKVWENYIHECKSNNIRLFVIITTIDKTTELMTSFFKQHEIPIISVQLTDSLTLLPIDPHPNAKGHLYISEKILSSIDIQ